MVKFYRCKKCGQMIAMIKKTGCDVVCCGEPMQEIIAGEVEASKEKHIPEYKVEGNKVIVNVGSIAHPMEEKHYIEWVCLMTKYGNQRHVFKPGDAPQATFMMNDGDEVVSVLAYCNLHGLWKA